MIWKTSGKKRKRNRNNKHNGRPLPRLEQAEDRISELEDEMEIKGKNEKLLFKQLKTCERKIQEHTDCIKRPNMRVMGIEEEEVQAKGIFNKFNKIITKFPKCRENFAHSGTGIFQETKQI
jgi:esterase/lipase